MREFEMDSTALLSSQYTTNLGRKYNSILNSTDNPYVKKGLALIDNTQPGYRDAMLYWKEKQHLAEAAFNKERMRYYGCQSVYSILWHIIQANPDIVFTDFGLSKWTKIPRTTVYYNIKQMIKRGDVIKLKRGFKSIDGTLGK